jgi:phosphatidylinositol glycan class O
MKTSSDLPPHKLLVRNERLRNAEVQLQTLVTNMFTNSNEENVHEKLHYLEKEYKEYMQEVKKLCKEVWAKFDMTSIVLGLLILGVTLLVNIYLLYLASSLSEDRDNGTMIIVIILSLVFIVFSLVQSFYLNDGAVNIMVYILGLFDFVALGMIILITRSNLLRSEKTPSDSSVSFLLKIGKALKTSIDNSVIGIIILITCLSYFSNSFVVFEDDVCLFLTQTCILFFYSKVILKLSKETKFTKDHSKTKSKSLKLDIKRFTSQSVMLVTILSIACSWCVRFSVNIRTKREEQMTEAEAAGETTDTNFEANKNVTYFFSVACLLVSIYLPRKWLTESGNLNSASFSTLCARYLMPVAAVATVLYWAMQHLPNKILDSLPVWQQVLLPQTVYICLLISVVAIVTSPMLVYTLPNQKNQMSISSTQNGEDIFHKVFKYVKSNWENDVDSSDDTSNDD